MDSTIIQINATFIEEAKKSPSLMSDMAAMERYMSESYSGRIIVELLQNADDAYSSRVLITKYKDSIVFANDGRPFDDSDVWAISRSGASSKTRGKHIGYRGVGFKSTTFLSSDITIVSNGTAFSFSKKRTAEALQVSEQNVPTIRIPFLVEKEPYLEIIKPLSEHGFRTFFFFQFPNEGVLKEEIDSLSPDLLIFLKHLQAIIISKVGADLTMRVERNPKDWGQEISIGQEKWGLIKNCIAFKMEDNMFVPCLPKEAVYYNFLPTYDQAPYPLKMNGDFSTDPSKKHIRQDEKTEVALDLLTEALANIIGDAFTRPNKLYYNLLVMLSENNSFSATNISFYRRFRQLINHRLILCFNDGTYGRFSDYTSFPDGFEKSIENIIRANDESLWKKSLPKSVCENLNGVDSYILSFGKSALTSQELINLLCDRTLVSKIPYFAYTYLLGKIILIFNRSRLISTEELDISSVLFKEKDSDSIYLFKNSKLSALDFYHLIDCDGNNNSLSYACLKPFFLELGLEYIEKKNYAPNIQPNATSIPDKNETIKPVPIQPKTTIKSSTPIIPKWRSAENACIEIEKFLGNDARDVSIQNLGYDIDSTTKDGNKRYIEVKSISKSDNTFSLTNNEYTAAHLYGSQYYICLIIHGNYDAKAIYIQNPIDSLKLEKRIKQWEWVCEEYQGVEIEINYSVSQT